MGKRKTNDVSAPKFTNSPITTKQRCLNFCEFSLASVEALGKYPFSTANDIPDSTPEWESEGGCKPACIKLNQPLRLRITLQHNASTAVEKSTLSLRGQVTIASTVAEFSSQSQTVGTLEEHVQFDIVTSVVNTAIGATKVKLNKFSLSNAADEKIALISEMIILKIYTIFGDPLSDNVKESTMMAPGSAIGVDEVLRLKPFFSQTHVAQACEWAKGASTLGTHDDQDIVLKVVARIPEIKYGEDPRYFIENDGWNVWDNPRKRTADCSQLASFFADVLGTLGVRARDFELKRQFSFKRKGIFRCYFGEMTQKGEWPTHGVLLMRYPNNDYYCYDTTFSYPRKRCTLTEALEVGENASFIKPAWTRWYLIKDDGKVKGLPKGVTATMLNKEFSQQRWTEDMTTVQAPSRFTDDDVQLNHPAPQNA